jgi:hypothetical protein
MPVNWQSAGCRCPCPLRAIPRSAFYVRQNESAHILCLQMKVHAKLPCATDSPLHVHYANVKLGRASASLSKLVCARFNIYGPINYAHDAQRLGFTSMFLGTLGSNSRVNSHFYEQQQCALDFYCVLFVLRAFRLHMNSLTIR